MRYLITGIITLVLAVLVVMHAPLLMRPVERYWDWLERRRGL